MRTHVEGVLCVFEEVIDLEVQLDPLFHKHRGQHALRSMRSGSPLHSSMPHDVEDRRFQTAKKGLVRCNHMHVHEIYVAQPYVGFSCGVQAHRWRCSGRRMCTRQTCHMMLTLSIWKGVMKV